MDFYDKIAPLITPFLVIIGTIYLGYNQTMVKKRNEVDQLDNKTIANLQSNVDSLELRIKLTEGDLLKAQANHEISMKEISRLTGENTVMKSLLEGKDALTKEFYEKSIQNMKLQADDSVKFDRFLIRFDQHISMTEQFITAASDFRKDVAVAVNGKKKKLKH